MGVTSVDTVVVCVMTDWAQTALVSAALVDRGFDGSELVCVTILDEALFGILGHSSLPTPVRHSGSNKKNIYMLVDLRSYFAILCVKKTSS